MIVDQEQIRCRKEPGASGRDPRTARFAICPVPRGGGLVASAFGMLCCRDAVGALLRRWLAPRQPGDAACTEFEEHTVVAYRAGWLDNDELYIRPRAPPARTDPRHYIVRDIGAFKCQGVQLRSVEMAAEALAELRAAGARALPLLFGYSSSEEDRAFCRLFENDSQRAPHTQPDNDAPLRAEGVQGQMWQARHSWLREQGGSFSCIATLTGRQEVFAMRPPHGDLVL